MASSPRTPWLPEVDAPLPLSLPGRGGRPTLTAISPFSQATLLASGTWSRTGTRSCCPTAASSGWCGSRRQAERPTRPTGTVGRGAPPPSRRAAPRQGSASARSHRPRGARTCPNVRRRGVIGRYVTGTRRRRRSAGPGAGTGAWWRHTGAGAAAGRWARSGSRSRPILRGQTQSGRRETGDGRADAVAAASAGNGGDIFRRRRTEQYWSGWGFFAGGRARRPMCHSGSVPPPAAAAAGRCCQRGGGGRPVPVRRGRPRHADAGRRASVSRAALAARPSQSGAGARPRRRPGPRVPRGCAWGGIIRGSRPPVLIPGQ